MNTDPEVILTRMEILHRTVGYHGQTVAALNGMVAALACQVEQLTIANTQMAQTIRELQRQMARMQAQSGEGGRG